MIKPAEAAVTLLIRVRILAIDAIGIIERRSRHLESDAMIAEVSFRFASSHSNSSSRMSPVPAPP
jgi:hypothetical protein